MTSGGPDHVTLVAGPRHHPSPAVDTWWWRHAGRVGNLGDAANLVVLAGFGLRPGPISTPRRPDSALLLAVGSVLGDRTVGDRHRRCVVWGSGWRGDALKATTMDNLDVRAVRGPHSAAAVGADASIPLGDPMLLVAHLVPAGPSTTNAVVVPHVSLPAGDVSAPAVGCDTVVSAAVRQRTWRNQLTSRAVVHTIETIAGASFVLAGALHAAIVAQAYGVPWAPWRGVGVDCPAKWDDWAAYLGIELEFVDDRARGERWWADHGSAGTVGDLRALAAAFPYDAVGMQPPAGGVPGWLSQTLPG